MQTILRPSPTGPTRSDKVSLLLFVPYVGGVVAAVFGMLEIGGLAVLGTGLAMTNVAGWLILLRGNPTMDP